jgi:hypothetical protein
MSWSRLLERSELSTAATVIAVLMAGVLATLGDPLNSSVRNSLWRAYENRLDSVSRFYVLMTM